MDERQLIELITRKVLEELRATGVTLPTQNQRLLPLVILDGKAKEIPGFDEFISLLSKKVGKFLLYLVPDTDQSLIDLPVGVEEYLVQGETESELEVILEQSTHFLLPWMSLTRLSRLVQLQPEDPVSLLLTKGLLQEKTIYARKSFLEPQVDLYQKYPLTPIYRRIQGLVQEGAMLGIQWLYAGFDQLIRQIQKKKPVVDKKLITETDVKELGAGGEIAILRGTIVTPLARDEMKRLNIKLRIC